MSHGVGALALRTRRLLPLLALTGLLLPACQAAGGTEHARQMAASPTPTAQITVTPGDEVDDWRPDKPVRVDVTRGELTRVKIRAEDGKKVKGDFSDDRTSWEARRTLSPATTYKVIATAEDDVGREVTERTSFTTLTPKATIDITSVNAAGGNTYGVGIPIVVRFDGPVYNKKRVERSFEVRASEPIVGAWNWMSRYEVHFRPREYWPVGTKVRFIARFDGVRVAKDVYGVGDVHARFRIGDRQITKVDTQTHTMKVYENGELVNTFPISAGKPKYPTTSGTHVVFERDPHVVMDSATVGIPKGHPEYYKLDVKWTVKFTFSGLYTHSAPWSAGSHGYANVSHGCINMMPGRAKWFYDFSQVGDIVKITGTPRALEWGNGWTDWDVSFETYLEGSAIGKPVKALTLSGESRESRERTEPSPTTTGEPVPAPTAIG